MGAFITNIHVRSDSASKVVDALDGLVQARAYVSQPKEGWVTIYDEASDEQDAELLGSIAESLSKKLAAGAIAIMVHDSDVLTYWLYDKGSLLDEFNSNMEYFGEEPDAHTRARYSGDAAALLTFCRHGVTQGDIEAVIHPPDGPPAFAEEMLGDLAKVLGFDETRITLGFKYFDGEGEDILPDAQDFVPIGGKAKKKSKASSSTQGDIVTLPFIAMAVGMLTKRWDPQTADQAEAFEALSAKAGGTGQDLLQQLNAGFDKAARTFLKQSKQPGLPTYNELKSARDNGPEALAKFVAQRAPDQLTEVGVEAAACRFVPFVEALIKVGLDSNAPSFNGRTALSVAEQTHGRNSKIYQLLEAASKKGK
jgi:hypothetical protein